MNVQSHMAVILFPHRLNLKDHINDDVIIIFYILRRKKTQLKTDHMK